MRTPDDGVVLLIALCAGPRCAALQRLRAAGPEAGEEADPSAPLRAAVRRQPRAVLMRADCLGRCERGSLVAVGRAAEASGGRLSWLDAPTLVGRVDDPARMRLLAGWAGGRSPRPERLPRALRSDELR
jgi:hypothetical protein